VWKPAVMDDHARSEAVDLEPESVVRGQSRPPRSAGVVIAALDGREHDADTLALASLIRAGLSADLVLAHVVPPALVGHGTRSYEIVARREGHELLARAAEIFTDAVEARLVEPELPAPGLARLADERDATVLVLGSSHRGAVGRVLLGSVVSALAANAPCAVAVAPAGYGADRRTASHVIGVAYDASAAAESALEFAVALAAARDASLKLWCVDAPIDPDDPQRTVSGTPYSHESARERLASAVARIPEGVAASAEVLEGHPTETLAREAARHNLDLLVVGSRTLGLVGRALAGSTSRDLLRVSPCPVVITPGPTDAGPNRHRALAGPTDLSPAVGTERGAVIVGIDRSDRCRDAVALGGLLARAEGRRGLLCCVASENASQEDLEEAEELARRAADSLDELPELDVRVVTARSAARGLGDLARQEHAGMIVVGSSHRGALGRLVPGDVASRLLGSAPCIVAVAPVGYADTSPMPVSRVAVAYDGTAESDRALVAAAGAATQLGAKLLVYHAMHEISKDAAWNKFRGYMEEFGRETVSAGMKQLSPGLEATTRLLEGDPAQVIAESAQRDSVAILYVGSRGYGPLREGLVGGVAGALLRTAHCPIVIVPRSTSHDADH
jgi:nucleotide-binding universal stress UspA family protein